MQRTSLSEAVAFDQSVRENGKRKESGNTRNLMVAKLLCLSRYLQRKFTKPCGLFLCVCFIQFVNFSLFEQQLAWMFDLDRYVTGFTYVPPSELQLR